MIGIVSVAMALTGASVSFAAPAPVQKAPVAASQEVRTNLDPATVKQALVELNASSLPRTTKTKSGVSYTTFELKPGFKFTIAEPILSGGISPRIGGGSDQYGAYVSFNQFDQDAIISGSGFLLGAAICAIPGVGWAACTVVGALLAAGALYLSYNGKCPNNQELRAPIWPGPVHCA